MEQAVSYSFKLKILLSTYPQSFVEKREIARDYWALIEGRVESKELSFEINWSIDTIVEKL